MWQRTQGGTGQLANLALRRRGQVWAARHGPLLKSALGAEAIAVLGLDGQVLIPLATYPPHHMLCWPAAVQLDGHAAARLAAGQGIVGPASAGPAGLRRAAAACGASSFTLMPLPQQASGLAEAARENGVALVLWAAHAGAAPELGQAAAAAAKALSAPPPAMPPGQPWELAVVASRVAHEINNALCAVLGQCELMAEARTVEGGRWRQVLRRLSDRAAELVEVVRGLEDLAALVQPVPLGQIDVGACVREAVERAEAVWNTPTVSITSTCPPGLAALGEHTALTRALTELIINAAESLRGGGSVLVGARREGSEIVIEVADTGCGMSADTLAAAFRPFFTTKPGRLGLGLTIARGAIEAMGGALEMASEPGAGTRAMVYLQVVHA